MDLKAPSNMKLDGNLAENWAKFKQRFMLYLEASEKINKPDKLKVALLLGTMGEECIEIYNSFKLSEEDANKFSIVLNYFDQYFQPKQNTVIARYKFFNCKQKEGESVDSFVTNLKNLSKDCAFETQEDSLIRDLLIIGVRDSAMKEKLLMEMELTLEKAIEYCRAKEASGKQMEMMNRTADASSVGAVSAINRSRSNKSQRNKNEKRSFDKRNKNKTCSKCNSFHEYGKCPAFGKKCYNCNSLNHFSSACKKEKTRYRNVNEVCNDDNFSETSGDGPFALDSVKCQVNSVDTEWRETVIINNKEVSLKIDTGAEVNVLPFKVFNDVKINETIDFTKRKLTSYTGHNLKVVGVSKLKCNVKNKSENLEFYIVDQESSALLGIEACEQLGFVNRNVLVNVDSVHGKNFVEEFNDVFSGKMGKLPYEYKIKLDANAEPKISAARVIPHSLKLKVKNEINKMVNHGILEKVVEPTDWVHPIVVVQKPNNQIRICMDPRKLNMYIKREHYPIPTQQNLFSQIEGEYFTVLDASSAFLQIPLERESSFLCTIATPFGRYKFNRLPYGLSSSPEVYQKTIDSIFEDLDGTLIYVDDILVFGKTEEEHDRRLNAVLKRAKESGLKLSQEKSQIKRKCVKYLGYNLSSKGISVNDEKIKAIVDFKAPTSKQELQRFLGMITYLGKFIHNLSDKTGILREILSKKKEFIWTANEQEIFEKLKRCVSSSPVLAYFNPNLKPIVSVDASQYGLGAVLLQEDHPICYASCALNETQQRYSQIEKELLAVVNGCRKFHYYVYGTDFVIETDHKPLLGLLSKPIENLSPRLQRMLFELFKYRFQLVHVPGKKLYVADALSRCPTYLGVDTSFLENGAATVHTIISATEERTREIQNATREDEDLSTLKLLIQNGWPQQFTQVSENLKPYWTKRDELHIYEDLIFLGQKLIIPKKMRHYVLLKLHSAHQGITACQAKAKDALYWPNIMEDIKGFIENCQSCQEHQRSNSKQPLQPYEVPKLPWEEVGIDFMYLKGENYLQLIDYHSKFIEFRKLSCKTAASVISALKQIFRTHGIPRKIHSDNGPPYDSQAYLDFLKSYDIQPVTSSPKYPRSNGMVERSIGTMKNLLFKVLTSGGDPNLAVLEYNNTPKYKLPSPAEMLMGRSLRTLVPKKTSLLKPKFPTKNTVHQLHENQRKQKQYYDATTTNLKHLNVQDPIYLQVGHRNWTPGTVIQKHSPRSYIVKSSDGAIYRRNRIHLRSRKETADAPRNENPIHIPNSPQVNISRPQPPDNLSITSNPDTSVSDGPNSTPMVLNVPTPEIPKIERPKRTIKPPVRFKDYV